MADRFRVVDRPVLRPTRCLRCMTHTGPAVDFSMELRGHGRLYLCVRCVGQLAETIGYLSPDQRESLLATIETLGQELADAQEALEKAAANRVVPLADVLAMREAL